jgi:hypothetical protein
MAGKVEITALVENYVDIFLPSTSVAQYPAPGKGWSSLQGACQSSKPSKELQRW